MELNIWRVIAVAEKRAQDIANLLLPGLGSFISLLIVLGGLVFNVGNIAGAGLGLNALLGIPVLTGALISAALAIAIFMIREAGKAMDRFGQLMGSIMIIAIIYIAVTSDPPVAEAALRTFVPEKIDLMTIITLVGGTVGGYITFSGGHRLLDAGIKGKAALAQVSTSAVMGISVASLVRVFLFLASLGIISKGLAIDAENPTGSIFQLAAGNLGYRLFGLVMFSAAITSVIGSAYTSVSFIKSFSPVIAKNEKQGYHCFYLGFHPYFRPGGKARNPVDRRRVVNGFILPVTLATILFAAYKTRIVGDYRHSVWLTGCGALVVFIMTYMSVTVLLRYI